MALRQLLVILVGSFLLLGLPLAAQENSKKLDAPPSLEELEKELKGPGLHGWIHGAVNQYDQYVFTYREPGNFFSHLEFPMTSDNPTVKEMLKKLGRHDEVIVKGAFLANHAPVKHIDVQDVSVVKQFENGMNKAPYQHEATLPEDLVGKTELLGKIHAVADEGKILVIEYKDAVVPVYVTKPELTKGLFRNDKVRLQYKLRTSPHAPTHVTLDVAAKDPIVVTDKLVDIHGKSGSVTGTLVLFPKSPQVLFNVFALQETDQNGIKREFTLVNFDDEKVFEAIRNKLQELWDAKQSHVVDGRNKFLNLDVRLKATGTFNVVDPGQANPQILLTGPDNIEIAR